MCAGTMSSSSQPHVPPAPAVMDADTQLKTDLSQSKKKEFYSTIFYKLFPQKCPIIYGLQLTFVLFFEIKTYSPGWPQT